MLYRLFIPNWKIGSSLLSWARWQWNCICSVTATTSSILNMLWCLPPQTDWVEVVGGGKHVLEPKRRHYVGVGKQYLDDHLVDRGSHWAKVVSYGFAAA